MCLTAGLALGAAACAATGAQPRYTISAGTLQRAAAERFPLRYPVAGLIELEVAPPQLTLRPERNRIASTLPVSAAGPALQQRYGGQLDLEFGLRYEPSDQTVRAHQLEVRSLRLPGLSPGAQALINGYLPALAREALGDVVLHQLQPGDLALADGLGFQPDTLTVTADGVVVGFAPRTGAR
ncbi:Conserved hypothetical protein [Ramlibacter tataouinensis TTB310]|uniref:DUF1439 domain-containing protein n=1 Tax=Ramlibacter tataouinensis (strain ATCC BAA-407 / DSM 14655 / LMG 21543 / TTB310) TaxID=365046 RepID=F5Y517_RAMTT|nr:Conserved hypothetical protein [Ramlibacter tataouinensis TTB310]